MTDKIPRHNEVNPKTKPTEPLTIGDVCRMYLDKKITAPEAQAQIRALLRGEPFIGKKEPHDEDPIR